MSVLLAESEIDLPKRGEIREGTVARISPTEVLVDIGAKTEGVINAQELDRIDAELRDQIQVGRNIDVYVVNPHARNGGIILSITKAEEMRDWKTADELLESQEVYEGELAGYNKGGMIMRLGQLRGFIPASQMSLARRRRSIGETPAARWGGMVGEKAMVKVIEVDAQRNRLILSERAASKENRARLREKLMAELEPGDTRTGRVNSIADFGAFVDLGGMEGLIHVSELTWKPIDHPSEVLKVGQEVSVQVINVDHERNRVGLSLKQLEPDPWDNVASWYQTGQLVEATITRLAKFGAFARLKDTPEIEGLVRIGELSHDNIAHPKEIVAEGDQRVLRIIDIDAPKRRMALSIREVDSARYADLDYDFWVNRETEEETADEDSSAADEIAAADPVDSDSVAAPATDDELETTPAENTAEAVPPPEELADAERD
ncbi:MAG: 30S ribosomal protein S1 [Anaerolineales bacterium]